MKKPLFNKIAIVGVGLIGGSLGLAIKKKKLARWVIGIVRHNETAKEAISRGVIDVAIFNMKEGVEDADLVILCGPVLVILNQISKISNYIKPSALVIDVGSTKIKIQKAGDELITWSPKLKWLVRRRSKRPTPIFIGCHPMSGSEKTGVVNSKDNLFKNNLCFVTAPRAASKHLRKIFKFWKALGAIPVTTEAKLHDAIVARISHLPHLLSFLLFQDFPVHKVPVPNPSIRSFARLSQSSPELWADIFLSNSDMILKAISSFEKKLDQWKQILNKQDGKKLKQLISLAHQKAYI